MAALLLQTCGLWHAHGWLVTCDWHLLTLRVKRERLFRNASFRDASNARRSAMVVSGCADAPLMLCGAWAPASGMTDLVDLPVDALRLIPGLCCAQGEH